MAETGDYPSFRLRVFLYLWRLFWIVLLPLALLYFGYRSRKDRLYRAGLAERFGQVRGDKRPVWIHGVSIGEVRSATPIVEALLMRGESVHFTTITPAGRREVARAYAAEISAGRVTQSWMPLDMGWCWARFLTRLEPRYGLVMEIEIWPMMIHMCRKRAVPLFACNAQYPEKSFTTDMRRRRVRADMVAGFAGALVKSDLQQERFRAAGQRRIAVTGELRFDQPLPKALIAAGEGLREALWPGGQPVICFASVVEGEDPVLIAAMQRLRGRARFVYVPRAPERFDETAALLAGAGFSLARRTEAVDAAFALKAQTPVDVLLGDSFGEMYGYLAMADRVVVGGGFVPKGAHNISEPLALGKPVWTGPHIWTIEYPAQEALAAGVLCLSEVDGDALADALCAAPPDPSAIRRFFTEHSAAGTKTLDALDRFLTTHERTNQ